MERRVLLAVVLSFLVLYGYQTLVVKRPPAPGGATARHSTTGGAAPSTAGSTDAAAAGGAVEVPEAKAPEATPVVGDDAERSITVETRDVIATFSNRGAVVRSWRLKHYLDQQGRPLELIESAVPNQPLPFTLRTADAQVNAAIKDALYAASGVPTAPMTAASTELRFEYQDTNAVHAVKTFRLDPSSYIVSFSASIRAGDRELPAAVLWGPAVGGGGAVTTGMQPAQGLAFENGAVTRLTAGDIAKQPLHEGNFNYAGVDDNYFMAIALAPGPSKVTYQPVKIPPPSDSKAAERSLVAFAIDPQRSGEPLKFFVGPKDFDLLRSIDADVARAVNFGRFSFIVVPLLGSLKWVNRYVGNWGWSIVILTNGIMAPLRHKQVMSMRKMQELQPEIKAIQDRY